MTPDLSLATTAQIADELLKRFDYVVLATAQEHTHQPGERLVVGTAFSGGELPCLGLVSVLQARLVATFVSDPPEG